MHWNNEADLQILRILVRFLTSQRIPIPYAEISAEFGVTTKAVRHRIRKLREEPVNGVSEGRSDEEGNCAIETTAADGEELDSPLEMPAGKKGRRLAGSRKLPNNKVREGRVGKSR